MGRQLYQSTRNDGLSSSTSTSSGSIFIPASKSHSLNLSEYFPSVRWNSTNTSIYGWLIQRTDGVASGVGQFALVQGGYRPTASGGCMGTILPFQVLEDDTLVPGAATSMWTNPSSLSDFSTCSILTDNKSGGFHYSGNIPWPGNTSHVMGYGYGLLNADNTAGNFWNSGTTNTSGIHNHNGQFFGLPDADGSGWIGCNSGYSQSDSLTRIHLADFRNPSSPSISVQSPGANTSTSPVMQFILQDTSNTSNTAIAGATYWRNASNYVYARIFAPSGAYTDITYNSDWNVDLVSGVFVGVALADGKVIVYHGSRTHLYTTYNSYTDITASAGTINPWSGIYGPEFGGSSTINDGPNSFLIIHPSAAASLMSKWTIDPNTYKWTRNWVSSQLAFPEGSSYMKLNKLPNGRLLVSHRAGSGMFYMRIIKRSDLPA